MDLGVVPHIQTWYGVCAETLTNVPYRVSLLQLQATGSSRGGRMLAKHACQLVDEPGRHSGDARVPSYWLWGF